MYMTSPQTSQFPHHQTTHASAVTDRKKNRLPRLKRVDGDLLPGFRLMARDAAILYSIYEYRAMTSFQIEALHFSRSTRSLCLKRLKYLYHHGFVTRDEQPQILSEGRKPLVYWLDMEGALVVAGLLGLKNVKLLDWRPGEAKVKYLFLEHLLATNDVRVAIMLSARRNRFAIDNWIDDRSLRRNQKQDAVVVTRPDGTRETAATIGDGYFVLGVPHRERPYHQFLEIDRGTVTIDASLPTRRDWGRKVRTYLAYYYSGKYQTRYGAMSMRILTVTSSETRLAHLKAATEEAGGKKWFWFTTLQRALTEDILTAPIWEVATAQGTRSLT
jgi:Replication-relaxation